MRRAATIAVVILAIALGGFSLELTRPTSVIAKAALPDPGLTGAPSQGTCFTCHSGGFNDLSGIIQIYNVPASYTPGQDYILLAAVAGVSGSRWGFEVTALTSGTAMAGSFSDSSNAVGEQTSFGIDYVSHTTNEGFDGTYADSTDGAAWVFKWTAPPQGSGTVTFYGAGVMGDNDNTANAGDFTYTTTVTSTEGASTGVEPITWGKIKLLYR
ncbi:MAG TPA: choice-of-anchor V domain-containing protein [Candidatus Limnocylindrales bacterium]|nr:choice-of-anchor V domain-containing protein [Candidatus Limnocylindrales bacterium]